MKLVSAEDLSERSQYVTEASDVVALEIAKLEKKNSIIYNLIIPCSLKIVEIVFGNEMRKKIAMVPPSDSTVERRISDIATDIKDLVVQEIKSSAFGLFKLNLINQLM